MNSNSRPMEILMVEDCRADARLAMEALSDGHVRCRMTLIPDGTEALQFLYRMGRFAQAPRPDLILLDLNLPGLDGRYVLLNIKRNPELREIPVVVMTSSKSDEDRFRSELLNVEGYLVKPLDMVKFVSLVQARMEDWDSTISLPALAYADTKPTHGLMNNGSGV